MSLLLQHPPRVEQEENPDFFIEEILEDDDPYVTKGCAGHCTTGCISIQ